TTGGITDTSKMSATVNGSSDNYVIKISETQEANEMAQQALTAAFGSLDAIRYLPIDISLYDSTGTQKISPIPEGVSINITMPIPDNLAIYGGNAKVACTEGGTLDKIQPKFTVINGVPCMNYTVTHLSPYVVYVDTNNLTATGTLDATPKTGDPIHPKWFLVIGLAAISGIMFLIRDRKETEAEAA
ncbi:MAG: LPXTG cell wall anchor domain-containing protein, partial [Lachnospiraceae bacterium]|nr:LPXTG cell wall anchor domain-containing protein [Lachnospiraceae bacterium]